MGRTALRSLTNEDYSDRELLHVLNDIADPETGYADTASLAEALSIAAPDDLTTEGKRAYAMRCTATRFSWMARFGWVERDDERTKWRLTPEGQSLMSGRLNKVIERKLEDLTAGDRILVMRHMSSAFRSASAPAATMLRREWQHGARRNGS